MNRVIQDGQELFNVTVTITGDTFSVEKNHGDSHKPPNPTPSGGGGPGEEHKPK